MSDTSASHVNEQLSPEAATGSTAGNSQRHLYMKLYCRDSSVQLNCYIDLHNLSNVSCSPTTLAAQHFVWQVTCICMGQVYDPIQSPDADMHFAPPANG